MKEINFNGENLVLQDANTRDVHNETRKAEQRKQSGLWQRRHRLNIIEREELYKLNQKYGTYTGPKEKNQ